MATEPAGPFPAHLTGLGERVRVLAFGKAADAMARGALGVLGERAVGGLVVTKYGHLGDALRADERLRSMESAHPVPDERSLEAGAATLAEVRAAGPDEHLLVLISGGGSALVESLVDGVDLAALRARTDALLAGGAPIGEINRVRRSLSRIKGGGLLGALRAGRTTQLLISDVPRDRVADVASGPLVAADGDASAHPPVDTRIVGSNAIARAAVVRAAEARGLRAFDAGAALDGDVHEVADRLTARFAAAPSGTDVFVAGGEPTLRLPAAPGRGGRNQHLAALVARDLASRPASGSASGSMFGRAPGSASGTAWLVCGTDGTDGPTDAAGGAVDARTLARAEAAGLSLDDALARADTGPWLEAAGALVRTGPTGTNVMDLAIGLRAAGLPSA